MSDKYYLSESLSDTYYKMLRKIRILKLKKPITRKELAIKLNINVHSPNFTKLIKICILNDLIKEYPTFGLVKILEINNNKLEKFIRRNSTEFLLWGQFIEVTKPLDYNY